jgi:hypothetical protein
MNGGGATFGAPTASTEGFAMANEKGSKASSASNGSASGAHASVKEEGFAEKHARFVAHYTKHPAPVSDAAPGDSLVTLANVRRGAAELAPHLATLRGDTTVDWTVVPQAVDLAEAYVFAEDQIVEVKVTREQIDDARAELQKLRGPGLLIARGLALLGHGSLERVEAIEAGKGVLDMARDGLALAAHFRDIDAVEPGLHPFNAARLERMERLSAWILRNVTPDGTAAARVPPSEVASRNYTLLWDALRHTHSVMRLGAFKVWGEAFSEHVPPLGSRVVSRRTEGGEAEPVTPTPTPVNGGATPTDGTITRPA